MANSPDPDYLRAMAAAGEMPVERFHYHEFGQGGANADRLKQDLWRSQVEYNLNQMHSPAADTTLGQASRFLEQPLADLATPNQYTNREGEREMPMPHIAEGRIPTLRNEPEMMHLDPGQFGGPQEPNIRIPHTFSEPNPEAPTNSLQKNQILAALYRDRSWPRTSTTNAFMAKEHELALGFSANGKMSYEDGLNAARRALAPGGDPDSAYNRSRVDANIASTNRNRAEGDIIAERERRLGANSVNQNANRDRNTDIAGGNLTERQAHDKETESQGAERINQHKYDMDRMFQYMMGLNKAGVVDPTTQKQMLDDMMAHGDEIPDSELGMADYIRKRLPRSMGGKTPTRDTIKGSPPYTSPNARGGKAPSAQPNTFEGAPPGKNVGDTLKNDGKPVARWNGQAWIAQ